MNQAARDSLMASEAKKAAGDESIDAEREAIYDEHFAIADADKDGRLS